MLLMYNISGCTLGGMGEYTAREWAQPREHAGPTKHAWTELFRRFAEKTLGRSKQLERRESFRESFVVGSGRVGSAVTSSLDGERTHRGARASNSVDVDYRSGLVRLLSHVETEVQMPADVVIQTGASDELAGALKAHAALRHVLQFDVYAEAIAHFFDHRDALAKRKQSVPYLISPRKARPLNVRLPVKLGKRVQVVADEDDVPPRRLVYTALVNYAVSNKLINSIGTIESGVVTVGARESLRHGRSGR
jgi:hypothetical protein